MKSDWRPISTAPKDGTKILAYGATEWEKDFPQVIVFWSERYGRPGWESPVYDAFPQGPFTHWQPLPSIPSE